MLPFVAFAILLVDFVDIRYFWYNNITLNFLFFKYNFCPYIYQIPFVYIFMTKNKVLKFILRQEQYKKNLTDF